MCRSFQGLCKNSKISLQNDKKAYEMKLDREAAKGIWGVKEEIYNRTSLSNTRLE